MDTGTAGAGAADEGTAFGATAVADEVAGEVADTALPISIRNEVNINSACKLTDSLPPECCEHQP